MADKVRVVQYGCGPIGCRVAALASRRQDIEIVGAIDIDKNKVGKDLGEVAGIDRRLGVAISDNAEAVFAKAKADIALHTTGSSLKAVAPQLKQILSAGLNVVSTTEELSYPFRKQPELAQEIDKLAKQHKVTVMGTGVNPGFVMDTWPLSLTAVCQEVKHVRVARIQDASTRRGPFQKKIGAGCTPEQFQKLVAAGTLKHVGLPESVAMIAAGLGWEIDEITETIEPIMASKPVKTEFVNVTLGQASGVKQVGLGLKGGKELIRLDFAASVGGGESYDAVYLTGTPNLEMVVKGGIHGDIATAAIVVNAARRVVEAPPGLMTMKDIPLVICTAG